MPSLITTPLRKDLLASAEAAHRSQGLDFASYFDLYFQTRYVFKGPDFFMMGAEDPEDKDAWLVWWAECYPTRSPREMLAMFLRFMPHYRSRVCWYRPMKHRKPQLKYYSTDRLLRIMNGPAPGK